MNKGKRLNNAHYFSPIFLTGFGRFDLASILFDLSFSHYNDLIEIKKKKNTKPKFTKRKPKGERGIPHHLLDPPRCLCARALRTVFGEWVLRILGLGIQLAWVTAAAEGP